MTHAESPTRTLLSFAHRLSVPAIPAAALGAAQRAVLDNVGCMIGGASTGLATQAAEVVELMGGREQATLAGRARQTSAPLAAFLNSVQANALDYDDAFERDGKGMGHPGSTVVPAALAVAELTGADGAQFLSAVVAGYEVANRVIHGIQPTPARHAQVWGVAVHQAFGAAVAAGKLLRLDEAAFIDAVGIAAALSTVPAARKWNWQDRPLASLKDVVAAPAETGVRAALLARAGWHGSRDILDGEQGFWVMAGSDRCDESRFTDGLGDRWTVESLSFKPYPACRWLHSAIEAAEEVMRDAALDATDIARTDIARIDVGTFQDVAENFGERRPATMVDAEFSMPWAVAVALAGVRKGPDWYSAETLRSPRVHALVDCVHLHVDAEAQARHFSEERKVMSVVEITTHDGRRVARRIATARGGSVRPWQPEELRGKFRDLAAPVIGAGDTEELADRLLSLDRQPDLRRVARLLGGFDATA